MREKRPVSLGPLNPPELKRPDTRELASQFAADLQYYLVQQPRQLPSKYLYDELGSALFEAICRLPWYPITRAEERLLARRGAEILRRAAPSTIVELGAGSGEKLKTLLEQSDLDGVGHIHLVDLSGAALEQSLRTLAPVVHVDPVAHRAAYLDGLKSAALSFDPAERVLVLFLGSNIGNFDPPGCDAFLRGVRGELKPGDTLLLGADLRKPAQNLLLAYDDPLGVTASFNRNLLVRVNRELGADFAVGEFAHRAVWNEEASRVEMHLVARSRQRIHVAGAGFAFTMDAGEFIWTESSYKYQIDEIGGLLEGVGFRPIAQWEDTRDRFLLTLAQAV